MDECFNVAIIGTDLDNCLHALNLVNEGKNILHIETSSFYGGHYQSTLRCIDEELFVTITKNLNGHIEMYNNFKGDRRILIDLCPIIFGGESSLASILLEKGLAQYLEFRPIQQHGIIINGHPRIIPKSKEEIMLDTSLSLFEKRQIMKSLNTFPSLDTISPIIRDMILYGICGFEKDSPIDEIILKNSIEKYVKGLSRFDSKIAFLYPFNGSNTIHQAICRAAAVKGAIHILDQNELSIDDDNNQINGKFDGKSWKTNSDKIIKESIITTDHQLARGIIITKSNGGLFNDKLCNYWIASPKETGFNTVHILQIDSASGCCPDNINIIYSWTKSDDLNQLSTFINSLFNDDENILMSSYYHGISSPINDL